MHYRNFDLNLLVALDALLAERNVTRAAERLNVTQPTMSNTLQRLRDHFKDDLLTRIGKGMELTPLALELLQPVRELLLGADNVLSADWEFDPGSATRTFRVAMSDYCAMILMPAVIRRLTHSAPNIRCEIVQLSNRAIAGLISGDIDLCVTAQDIRLLDPAAGGELFSHEPLFSDEFVCVVSRDHPDISDTLSLDQYMECPHIVVRFGDGTLSMEERALQKLEMDVPINFVATSFGMLTMLIPGTPLIATVQSRLADRMVPAMTLNRFRPPIEIPDLVETMFWHRRFSHDRSHQWLRNLFKAAAEHLNEGVLDH